MNRNELEEVFLSSQEVFHGKLINVEHWQVRLPNGQTALREVVKHRGAAAIVPVDDQGNVDLRIFGIVFAARLAGEQVQAGMQHLPVNLAYVVDPTAMRDETVDFSKLVFAGVAFITDIGTDGR